MRAFDSLYSGAQVISENGPLYSFKDQTTTHTCRTICITHNIMEVAVVVVFSA